MSNNLKNAVSLKVALASASNLGTLFGQGYGARADFDVKVAEMVRVGAVDMKTVVKGNDNDDVDKMIAAFFNAAAEVASDLALNPDTLKTARSQYHAIAHASKNDNVDFPAVMSRVQTIRDTIANNNRFTLHQCYVNVAVAQSAEFREADSKKRKPVAVSDETIRAKCTKKAKKNPTLLAYLTLHQKALTKLIEGKVAGLSLPDDQKATLARAIAILDDMISDDETDMSSDEKAELAAFRKAKAEAEAKAAREEEKRLAKVVIADAATRKPTRRDGKRPN